MLRGLVVAVHGVDLLVSEHVVRRVRCHHADGVVEAQAVIRVESILLLLIMMLHFHCLDSL